MAKKLVVRNPHNGAVVIRIGGSQFNLMTDGSEKSVKAKIMEQLLKITQAGGSFDYIAGYPKKGDALVACKKGMVPEMFPELME